ncbi:MAG: geranylgeranylglyceryl/heptaprenylglyceryl phosphate synthase [Infirmifilum sp.]
MRKTKVRDYLLQLLKDKGAIHMTLIDPDKTSSEKAARIAVEAVEAGTSAIMVGGSIGVSESMTDEVVLAIKNSTNVPVILFPGTPSALSRHADAVWFMSVLNSQNPYFITGAQMQGAPIVKRYGLEALSLGYIILGSGGAVSLVSYTRPLPFEKPDVVAAYALAAEYMGFSFVYLEGGSGADPIPPIVVRTVRKTVSLPIIVGGGIREPETARELVMAGADIIVTGTLVEEVDNVKKRLHPIITAIEEGVTARKFQDGPSRR